MKASNFITAIITYLLVFQGFQTPAGNCVSVVMICADKAMDTHASIDHRSIAKAGNRFAASPMASLLRW